MDDDSGGFCTFLDTLASHNFAEVGFNSFGGVGTDVVFLGSCIALEYGRS